MKQQNEREEKGEVPYFLREIVLTKTKSDKFIKHAKPVQGYDFNKGINFEELISSYSTTGFQATHFSRAVEEVNRMLQCRSDHKNEGETDDQDSKCKIFFGFTSNLIASGVRESILYLVQHKLVDVIVTTAGSVEKDLIKCFTNFFIEDFEKSGEELDKKRMERIGNVWVCGNDLNKFEKWLIPILDKMVEEQETNNITWTPSAFIHRMGKEINNEKSVLYWCYKNNIPVFCPAITDGKIIGKLITFHSYKQKYLILDIVEDIISLNREAWHAKKTGMLILGGGIVKHHITKANLMHDGADFAVYINHFEEFDGSESGATLDEAVACGKLKEDHKGVKIHGDATLIFPLLVAQTFAKVCEEKI